MALSPRALLVGGWGRPGPLIWERRVRRQLLAFTLATILELCFMLTLCYHSQNYSRIIFTSLAATLDFISSGMVDTAINITANSLLHRAIQTNQHGKSCNILESLVAQDMQFSLASFPGAPTQHSTACSTEKLFCTTSDKKLALDKTS